MADREKPGKAPTSDDVALLAGVSRSAVSRTFTRGASVSPETRRKVLDAAKALGYRVNFLARGLTQRRTNLVGLVVSDMENSFRSRLVDCLARALVALDYRPFMLPSSPGDDVGHLVDMMLHYNVSGAIVTSDTSPAEIVEACAAHGVPLVLVNKQEMSGNVANVSLDADKAGRLAAEALRDSGCRRVAIASQVRPSFSIDRRKQAFKAACARMDMEVAGDYQGAVQNYAGGIEAARAFAAAGADADGVFCGNDFLALGFLDHLRGATAIAVPGDLCVVACDDIDEAGWLSYDLTTVRQDPRAMAAAAVEALVGRIERPAAPSAHTVIDAALVVRGTTRHSPVFP